MEGFAMMKVSEENGVGKYVYNLKGRTIKLDKDIVDRYTEFVCPMSEDYVSCLLEQFGKGVKDNILSCKIALGMAMELSGFEYAK